MHAHSGEEYRQELRKGIERWGDRIQNLAWGVGSGFVGGTRTGHVFCARVCARVFMRFVPMEPDAEIERDTLTCLGILSCTEHTECAVPEGFAEGAFGAWERARRDIYDEWMRATDPATLQPSIRPLFRAAADHVRMHAASRLSAEERDRLADALEAPWGIRQERRLRQVFAPDDDAPGELTRKIADVVNELGLQPWKPPEPLDPNRGGRGESRRLDGGSGSGPLTEMQRRSHLGAAQLSRSASTLSHFPKETPCLEPRACRSSSYS